MLASYWMCTQDGCRNPAVVGAEDAYDKDTGGSYSPGLCVEHAPMLKTVYWKGVAVAVNDQTTHGALGEQLIEYFTHPSIPVIVEGYAIEYYASGIKVGCSTIELNVMKAMVAECERLLAAKEGENCED